MRGAESLRGGQHAVSMEGGELLCFILPKRVAGDGEITGLAGVPT